ncbi:KIFC3 isoform 3, partial [Pan troglodytes]
MLPLFGRQRTEWLLQAAWCPEEAAEPQAMVPSRRTWNLGATPSLRGLWRVGRAPEPEPGMARPAPAPASPAARPFPHTGPGRLRTGRGKDTPVCGDEDSSARSAARPALAQCRALSVDWAGPGSPHGLYLTLQVEHLKEKLISQAQEVSRLRSELGGTDLEKHRDLLMVENERLRQEMRRCEAELQELRT